MPPQQKPWVLPSYFGTLIHWTGLQGCFWPRDIWKETARLHLAQIQKQEFMTEVLMELATFTSSEPELRPVTASLRINSKIAAQSHFTRKRSSSLIRIVFPKCMYSVAEQTRLEASIRRIHPTQLLCPQVPDTKIQVSRARIHLEALKWILAELCWPLTWICTFLGRSKKK